MSLLTSTALLSIPGHGNVTVTPRRNATRITLRAAPDGSFRASAPYAIAVNILTERLAEMMPRLTQRLPDVSSTPRYYDGWSYAYAEGTATLRLTPSATQRNISVTTRGCDILICVPDRLSLSDPAVTDTIATLLKKGASYVSRNILPRQAALWAAELGITAINWEIGQGSRTLGSCYPSQRRIRLSGRLLFLPEELRRFVVCHELAHLTHPDHSPAFHALSDRYCHGRERALLRRLRSFPWP